MDSIAHSKDVFIVDGKKNTECSTSPKSTESSLWIGLSPLMVKVSTQMVKNVCEMHEKINF